jgi:hypothetical protein
MADKAINDLTPAEQINTNDLFVLEQNSTAKKLTGQILVNWLTHYADGHGGIQTIAKTATAGLVDTYTITFSDTSISTFTVTNGAKGDTGNPWYVWIKYASDQPTADADMGDVPDKWIGIYSGTLSTAPTSYTAYAWYEIKGAKGDTGDPAALLQTTTQYQASNVGDTIPTTWEDTIPQVGNGEYLWTKVTATFNSGDPLVWYSVAYNGVNGTGAVASVNSQNPDGNGNVTVGAANISSVPVSPAAASGTLAKDIQDLRDADTGLTNSKQDKVTAAGILKGVGNGVINAATKGTDYAAKSFTVQLTANGWSNNAQTVSSADFVASGYAYSISPASASRAGYIDAGIYADDVTTNGSMTFHCDSVPSSALTVNVIRMVSA